MFMSCPFLRLLVCGVCTRMRVCARVCSHRTGLAGLRRDPLMASLSVRFTAAQHEARLKPPAGSHPCGRASPFPTRQCRTEPAVAARSPSRPQPLPPAPHSARLRHFRGGDSHGDWARDLRPLRDLEKPWRVSPGAAHVTAPQTQFSSPWACPDFAFVIIHGLKTGLSDKMRCNS